MKTLRKPLKAPKGEEPIKVNKVLKPVKKGEKANVEAEAKEIAIAPMMFDGFPASFVVGGERHSNGGTKLNLPENSFIFSDTHEMKIKNADIQKDFGKREKASGYTPAEIAKQYDINEYRRVLADPNSDKLQRETAEQMIKNYNEKLGKLALVQESKKGFPKGVPFVAIPYLEMMGIDASQLVRGNSDQAEVPTAGEEDIPQQRKGGQIKIRITKVPNKLQKGGPSPSNQEFAYNPQFYADFAKKIGLNDISAILPSTLSEQRGMVTNLQPSKGKNVFGRKDWTDPQLFDDFKTRNAWYFEKNPNFDPTKPSDVKDFQKAYNNKAEGMGLNPYFSSKPGSKYSLDSKFGEVTYSVPNLEQRAATEQSTSLNSPINQTLPDLQRPNLAAPAANNQDNPFWTQDIVNMAGAFGDQQRIRKYLPWQSGYDTVLPTPTYYDPTRELASNSEQASIADQALGAFAGPQALSSRIGSTQGQALENAANILGKYNDLNVGVANQNENIRANITNESNLNRAQQATNLYDKTVLTNQNYQNAQAQARQNIRQAFIQAWTNRGQTQALNSMNKQYKVDPRTGFVQFSGVPGELNPNQQSQTAIDLYNQILNQPGQTPESATKLLEVIMGKK